MGFLPIVAMSAAAAETKQKNVVILYMDDQSNQAGYLGTPGLKTPNLDALAAKGVIFTRAFSGASVCSPSRATLLTGMLPQAHGLYRLVADSGLDFPRIGIKPSPAPAIPIGVHDDIPTLIEILSDHGFFTAITQKTHVQPIWKFPFSKGYDYHNKPSDYARLVGQVVDAAQGKPFFLEANISPPHRPFEVHLSANDLLDDQGRARDIDPAKIEVPPWLADTPAMREDLAKYYECIQLADACAGAVLQGLRDRGLLENTLIIYSSDNGMGYHRAKVSGYPAGLLMPMVIAGPGVEGGRTVKAPVSQIDVMPTILKYLDLPIPGQVEGLSLWPVLEGGDRLTNRATVMGTINEQYVARAVCDGRFYYIRNISKPHGTLEHPPMNADLFQRDPWRNGSFDATLAAKDSHPEAYRILVDYIDGRLPDEELYDLDNDPWAMKNLMADPAQAGTLAALRSEMDSWRKSTGDVDNPDTEIHRRTGN